MLFSLNRKTITALVNYASYIVIIRWDNNFGSADKLSFIPLYPKDEDAN